VNRNNVVPFDPSIRTALARRGAPDKSPAPLEATLEIECAHCACVAAVDLAVLYAEPSVDCMGCGAAIPLIGREWMEGTR
jgi:hypothetical protein